MVAQNNFYKRDKDMKTKRILFIAILVVLISVISFANLSDEDKAEFARHRAELFKRAGDELIIVTGYARNNVDKNLYYLTGSTNPNVVLVMNGKDDSVILFHPIRGNSIDGLKAYYGIADVRNLTECKQYISEAVKAVSSVMIRLPQRGRMKDYPWSPSVNGDNEFKNWLKEENPKLKIKNVALHLDDMRRVKTPWEIKKMEESCRIGGLAHVAAMKATKPGIWEYQLAAEAKKVFSWNAAFEDGFPCIATSGPNNLILHYSANTRQAQEGELILMDYGCDYQMYVSDISRTWPVGGKFSERHRKAYQDLLDVQKQVIKAVKPGQTLIGLDALTRKLLKEKGYAKNIKHGVTHYLGMLVHDVGAFGKPFEPGVIVTVEPGIYFKEEGWGIRIEDDILVTADGQRNLTADVPKEIDEIEALASTWKQNNK